MQYQLKECVEMEEICRIIEQALELKEGSVGANDNMDTIEKFDSLGLLAILSALEKRYGNKVASIDELAGVKSVREIFNLLEKESLI